MSNTKFFASILLSALFGGLIAVYIFQASTTDILPSENIENKQDVVLSKYLSAWENETSDYTVPEGLNFVTAAEKVTPAVVHIKTYYDGLANDYGKHSVEDLFRKFFGDEGGGYYGDRGLRMSSGSGVIITDDGYIATNNHVIDNAQHIEVVLNDKRSFKAKVVGTDPSTDLALIKIKEKQLPFIPFGDSDNVKIGQWVLAVGNPFDLTSTVTAGIISGKARNINILRSRDNLSIESFIQTDAAVNPGNSGGALVDLNGNLIGINTAIATTTGTYSGYSFAVPVSLVKKVMNDLSEFGEVQRALMGVSIQNITAQLADYRDLETIEGVYVLGVTPHSGAEEAGLREGDVIITINGVAVNMTSELQELVARNSPGDKIKVVYRRNGKTNTVTVILKNKQNNTKIVQTPVIPEGKVETPEETVMGAVLEELSEADKETLNVEEGIRVKSLDEGMLKSTRMEEGFIITHIDKVRVSSLKDFKEKLQNLESGVIIEGVYPDGQKAFYGLGY
ncbi:Do family serine endopeptidase [Rapidithrix thailandica]|uniref:Do family serine endopeptidase n=1 Tax=Rapidithrix thailandica TaxID=413964 RepID=A0AAW9SAL7_9BACT